MSKSIDIREENDDYITEIVFADRSIGYTVATRITRKANGIVAIEEEKGITGGEDVRITSQEDARNLIKALEKAIDLGWLSEKKQ